MTAAPNYALNLPNPGISSSWEGTSSPIWKPCCPPEGPSLDICQFSILHPSFLCHTEPMVPSQGKTTTKKAGFSHSSDVRFSWRPEFLLFQSQKNRAGSGRQAKVSKHIFSLKKASLNSPVNDNSVAAAGRGEKDPCFA